GGLWRLDEQHVGASLAIFDRALDRAIKTFDGNGVGTGDDEGVAGAPGIDRGAKLAAHFGGRDQHLAIEMTAALGKILILDLYGVGADAFELPHRAGHVKRVAIAAIAVKAEICGVAVADR